MKYDTPQPRKRDILDDSVVKETLGIIEDLLDMKLDLDFTTEKEIVAFLDYPERFIQDEKTIEDIRNLKELIIEMSDLYYAE